MLVSRNGGKERTKEELQELVAESGLQVNRIIQTAAPFSIIEIKKPDLKIRPKSILF